MMSAIETVRARVTPELKANASQVLGRMGLTVSDAIRLLLMRVVSDEALPFAVRVPNEATVAAIEAGEAGDVTRFSSVDELFDTLTPKATRSQRSPVKRSATGRAQARPKSTRRTKSREVA